jgi:WhiB family redox-sensing transcriptional regulator
VSVRWQDSAACNGRRDIDWFPSGKGGRGGPNREALANLERARQVCSTCPVLSECLKYALEHDMVGIWAGTTTRGRRGLDRRPPPIPHGTYGGYQAHLKRGDAPCDDCRTAMAEYKRALRHGKAS